MTFIRNNQINVLLFADVSNYHIKLEEPKHYKVLKSYFEYLEHKIHVIKLSKLGFLRTTTKGVLLCLYIIICITIHKLVVGCGTSGAVPPSSIKRA